MRESGAAPVPREASVFRKVLRTIGGLALPVIAAGCTLAPDATWTAPPGEAVDASLGGRTLPDDDASTPMNAYVVDRIVDGTWAVLEHPSGVSGDVPLDWLPAGVAEGDVVRVTVERAEGAASAELATRRVSFALDRAETARRRADATQMREGLRKGPSGDLDL